uniref:Chromosome 16 open reading frame 89 n=1 Tax=Lepisosteus oculatus TaxID=7918 RepID=W5MIN6_LEPOC
SMKCSHLLSLAAVLSATVPATEQDVISDVLSSLDRAAGFFENEFRDINLDGVVGYRILSVELAEALKRWQDTDPGSSAHLSRAQGLARRLNDIIAQAVTVLQHSDPKYYREFEPILETRFWTVPDVWNTSDPTLAYAKLRDMECYDEQLSDKCMTLLLGTWKDNGTPCIVTKSCRETMTRFGCPRYSLSHQLLYFMMGRMQGCSNILQGEHRQARANLTIRDYEKIFCSNMMKSNVEFEKDGYPSQTRDIFIENIMLCGLAGFSDFYKSSWLQHIFFWQDPEEGCFGKDGKLHTYVVINNLLETLQLRKRVKRREKTLKDGCSSHMTGVAVSTLGGYLNYYLTEQDITKRPLT